MALALLLLTQTQGGRKQLVQTLIKAVHDSGFIHVKSFNTSQERFNHQFEIRERLYEIPL